MSAVDEKSCPMCGETIKAAARVCRYCGERVDSEPTEDEQERIEEAAKKLLRERSESNTALQLLLTSLIGCAAPICAVYGLVFLLRHREPFPRRWMAVVGTVLHCIWTLLIVGAMLLTKH